jgi:hypothetical protein
LVSRVISQHRTTHANDIAHSRGVPFSLAEACRSHQPFRAVLADSIAKQIIPVRLS